MQQHHIAISRLKNPSVILSIVSEILTILVLVNVNIDMRIFTGIITAVCSILVLLGIVSDPSTKNRGYGDDLRMCEKCNKISSHVWINGKFICKNCGCEYKE